MTTKIEVLNASMTLLGQPTVAALTDTSTWFKRALAQYPGVVRALLEQHPWNFPATCEILQRLSETPVSRYAYAHNKPSDLLRINRVSPNNDPTDLTDYDYDDEGGKILTDFETTYCWFISSKWMTREGSWPQVFADAVAAEIRARVAPNATKSDRKQEGAVMYATRMLKKAKSFDASQKRSRQQPPGKWVRSRISGLRYNTEGN